jgi:hypothetical protein
MTSWETILSKRHQMQEIAWFGLKTRGDTMSEET